MTQEDKELLLHDLSARLPYGVVVELDEKFGFNKGTWPLVKELLDLYCVEGIKPYLRPITSMTVEEKEELVKEFCGSHTIKDRFEEVCWYLSKHLDVNGLIPKGIAIEVTEDNNPYKE